MSKCRTLYISVFAQLMFNSCAQHAVGQATLSWNVSTERDLAGYKAYIGTAPRAYGIVTDVGKVTEFKLNTLIAGVRYYFAVTAYDTAGNESGYSEEVNMLYAPLRPKQIRNFTINGRAPVINTIDTLRINPTDTLKIAYELSNMLDDGTYVSFDSLSIALHMQTNGGAWFTLFKTKAFLTPAFGFRLNAVGGSRLNIVATVIYKTTESLQTLAMPIVVNGETWRKGTIIILI